MSQAFLSRGGKNAGEGLRDQQRLPAEVDRYRVDAQGVAPVEERVGEYLVQPVPHGCSRIEHGLDLDQAPPHDEIRRSVAAAQLGGEDHPAAASVHQLATPVRQVSLPQGNEPVEVPATLASASSRVLAVPSGDIRTELHQGQAARLGGPAAERGPDVPHPRRF